MECYLQRVGESFWEKVDEFVYSNWDKALTDEDTPRYNGNVVLITPEGITSHMPCPLMAKDFALIARFTGAGPEYINGNYKAMEMGSICKEPKFVRLKIRNKMVLRDINKSSCWK